MRYRPKSNSLNISAKANRVLNIILIAMILIVLRIWHLAVIQYEDKLEESRKPQRRVVMEAAKRASIRDRFNIPLAINKVQYQAAISYAQLREIPSVIWEKALDGKKIKKYKRREYITRLAQLLSKELKLDPERLEDLIHSKASLYYQIPFVIKEDISEKEYYRLKMMEKDWLGIHVQQLPRRYYPKGKVAADIIGYMGAINRQEYEAITYEIKVLGNYIKEWEAGEDPPLPLGMKSPDQALSRLKDLEEHAYTINDYVGKTGIEGRFEQHLRGFHGKKSYYSDARGNFLRELPGSREPLSGQRFLLTISSELQEYAEQLLAQNERIRQSRLSRVDTARQVVASLKQSWIKGGGIAVMDPRSGDLLALASYPRFDPNDFIVSGNPEISKKKRSNIQRWFESELYLAEIWDQKRPLERELYHDEKQAFFEENLALGWEKYLDFILAKDSVLRQVFKEFDSLGQAAVLQRKVEELLILSGQDNAYALFNAIYKDGQSHQAKQIAPSVKQALESRLEEKAQQVVEIRKVIDPYFKEIPHNYDKVLLVDLCRLAVNADLFSPELLKKINKQSLSAYRQACAAKAAVEETVHGMVKELYHCIDFKDWRIQNEREFLKAKRAEEKASQQFPKPYLDYLDGMENEMAEALWQKYRWQFLAAFLTGKFYGGGVDPSLEPYMSHFLTWHKELACGAHSEVGWRKSYETLKYYLLQMRLNSNLIDQYLKTLRSYRQLSRPLLGSYRFLRKSGPSQLEKDLACAFYPRQGFGCGRSQIYRQAATQGSIFKLVTAYEGLVQRYHSLEQMGLPPVNLNPLEIVDQVFRNGKQVFVGYTEEGKPIPQLYKGGRLPKSSSRSIGKVDMLRAIEWSSNPYFAILAGDILKNPEDLNKAARLFSYGSKTGIDLPGEISGKVPIDLSTNRTGLYATAIGQHSLVVTPLQTAVMLSAIANGGKILKPKIVKMSAGRQIFRENEANKDFPSMHALADGKQLSLVVNWPTEVKRQIFMPAIIRQYLLEGMRRVVAKAHKDSLGALSKFYRDYPEAISDYIDLKDQLIGKTSTSESMENMDLDLELGTNKYTHVWFGGISFLPYAESDQNRVSFVLKDSLGQPELVVVIYLRFGEYGKEAAPLAAQIVKKWHEIKKKYHI